MFTGIITHKGRVAHVDKKDGQPLNLVIEVPDEQFIAAQRIGDSVAIDGVCLSVVTKDVVKRQVSFQAIEQTCTVTTIGTRTVDDIMNLEGSLKLQDKLDGHMVTGHVDQTAKILDKIQHQDGSVQFFIENQRPELVILRGSIALNGVSLTVSHVTDEYFCVSLIPITLDMTNLSHVQKGDTLNVEYDLLLKSSLTVEVQKEDLENLIGTRIVSHQQAMRLALQLGEQGRATAPPNPWVSCVIVKDNIIIGAGYHTKAGQPHAEIEALSSIEGSNAAGADMYVTLEPCCHTGRTGPCTEAIIKAGIQKVFIALRDPDKLVAAKGIRLLNDAGIATETDLLASEAAQSLKSYLYHRTHDKPYVIVKAAISIDGKMAASDGSSKWISSDAARKQVHTTRSHCQAVLVGSGTVEKDNPQLTVRLKEYQGPQPMRVVLDTLGTLTNKELNIFNLEQAQTLMVTSKHCNEKTLALWNDLGISYLTVPVDNKGLLDLDAVYRELGKRGVLSLLIEGGSGVHTHVLKTSAFNELQLYIGNVIIGNNGLSIFDIALGTSMDDTTRLKKVRQDEHCLVFER